MEKTGHVLVALRRVSPNKNENVGLTKLCHRMVVREGETVEQVAPRIKEMCHEKGTWRLYRSVNKRDFQKALNQTQIKMIIHPEHCYTKLSSVWKSVLMTSDCKAERNFLLDFDSENTALLEEVKCYLRRQQVVVHELVKSPNGYHIITDGFDTRELLNTFEDIEVKRDALVFLDSWTN